MARGKSRRHLSLRIEEPTVVDLDRLARQIGTTRNALADRYLAEGVRRDEFPQIEFRDGALGRRAALLGTRLDVWQLIETVRNNEDSVEEAAEYLGLPVSRVRAAVRYYAAYQGEVDEIAAREIGAAERAEELWRAERRIFAS